MKQKISEAEWRVLDALWELSGGTAAEVAQALSDTGWSRNTVHTFLTRLTAKGYVCAADGRAPKRYLPLLSREDCVREETRSFVSRVFDGSASQLMRTFLQQSTLSETEAEELRALLDQAEARGK
ncbi:BlaI/MecI/CopY family transcriptional regulator [Agathobaculum sp.]|uniref:BlaI/MecI/CopY family transcriptional regulator n=1 Tax=Agathobaculum sp. TaxID=2048138 RepID=UPI002A80D704|nr:BlaI/MecI/CopY family transcriptional regulator [Agathobaculum sp.]MDY3618746.1 BlaI/MecI/CopY family transcriptional regulator [Agathobaculum sp.]